MKIAFVDTLGLCYDGSTLEKRGLGGSESAVIYMAHELQNIGFDVAVYNDCTSDDCKPGIYDGVQYVPVMSGSVEEPYDVVIVSRSVKPFLHEWPIVTTAKQKVLWMHDTFCEGDNQIEDLVNAGRIDEIFTLSDWHTAYVTNCDHGKRRNFDVLKNKIFQTRNGVGVIPEWVDVKKKDPHLFVYNASVTKGMIPLVTKAWPKIKAAIPEARLCVIGGYYRFRDGAEPDEQEKAWRKLVEETPDVLFTGIITQKQISDILRNASYFLYPSAFPETFGISTLEALLHNVTPITCRNGALEETAIDAASYKINYTVEKNWSCPWLDQDDQIDKFVELTVNAYSVKYLHQQKQYACNAVKDICGWDTVALQWKQHLFHKLGEYLAVDEYRKVQQINYRVSKVFGRRFANLEAITPPKKQEKHIQIVTPVYNAEGFIAKCIQSVAAQDYDNWSMNITDDASTDNTLSVIKDTISKLPAHLHDKFFIIENKTNRGAVYNQFHSFNHLSDTINMMLDGDDWLVNDPNIFNMYNNLYHEGVQFTYGSCWSLVDNIPLIAQEYPPEVRANRSYRDYKFNWNMPYTHLRTFTSDLLDDLEPNQLKDENGNWYKAGGDSALFYALIELADPFEVHAVPDVVYVYNDKNPINDYKVNGEEQTRTANKILAKKEPDVKKNILIAIPCKNDIEADTFKSIYDLEIPEGYTATFQYFYGYAVDQVRNLIADWIIKGYDYLFAVDHDMVFAPDTLKRLLERDVDIASALYIQRLDPPAVEAYDFNMVRLPIEECFGFREVGGVGMGCALIKKHVFERIPYPHYVYHQSLDHSKTFSEDLDFCRKAREKGFQVWLDSTIQCKHIGQRVFEFPNLNKDIDTLQRLRELGQRDLLPAPYTNYMEALANDGFKPKVIYDIGACVLHWTNKAIHAWPDAHYVAFEAMDEVNPLCKEAGIDFVTGVVLGNKDDIRVDFYQNLFHPGGNSIYKENSDYSSAADQLFGVPVQKDMYKLDTLVTKFKIPTPDLLKIDAQGAELDILRGAEQTLAFCNDLFVEVQQVEYNKGAPNWREVANYLFELGFKQRAIICSTDFDMDVHFSRN